MNKGIAIEEGDQDQGTYPALPHNCIYEILARSPLKSLMRFKAVSKEWLNTIHDQSLATEFSIHRPQTHTAPTALIYFYGTHILNQYYSLDLDSGLATPFEDVNQLDFMGGTVWGTVMGLTCFEFRCITYFWNLSTREITALPQIESDIPVSSWFLVFSSLGFDPVKGQYKILKASTLFGDTSKLNYHNVLTLGTSEWRKLDNGLINPPRRGPVFLHGKLHFFISDIPGNRVMAGNMVMAFHVGTEKFEVIDLPKGAAFSSHSNLIPYKDCLAVVDYGNLTDEEIIILYILEDYHNRKWVVKEVVMPRGWRRGLRRCNFYVSGISTGEILLTPENMDGHYYVLRYDVEKMSMKKVEIHGLHDDLLLAPCLLIALLLNMEKAYYP